MCFKKIWMNIFWQEIRDYINICVYIYIYIIDSQIDFTTITFFVHLLQLHNDSRITYTFVALKLLESRHSPLDPLVHPLHSQSQSSCKIPWAIQLLHLYLCNHWTHAFPALVVPLYCYLSCTRTITTLIQPRHSCHHFTCTINCFQNFTNPLM